MLDPNEWTLAMSIAVVRKRDHYAAAQPMHLISRDDRHVRAHTHLLNGRVPGEEESVMAAGAMENQARAILENILEAAERVEPRRDRHRELAAIVVNVVNDEPTLQEIWRD